MFFPVFNFAFSSGLEYTAFVELEGGWGGGAATNLVENLYIEF